MPTRDQTQGCRLGLARLALTEKEIKSIQVPVTMPIGNQDGLNALYVDPLKKLRRDWPVVEIRDANHITCIAKPQFRDEIADRLKQHRRHDR